MTTPPAHDHHEAGELLELLHHAQRHLRRDAAATEDGECTSPGQVRLLRMIAHAGGPVRSTDVATALGVTPRSVTSKVDQAEEDGYVRRVADPHDRRARLLELTDAGRRVLDQSWARRVASAQRRLDRLEPDERTLLLDLLRRVVDDRVIAAPDPARSATGEQ